MDSLVQVSPVVQREIAEAYVWYKARSPKVANAFRAEVLATFDPIAHAPERWPLWDDTVRRCILKQYPYTVYFSLVPGEVRILAVGHHRRHAGYWAG